MASGQGIHWLIESPTCFHVCVARPPEICIILVFKHIHAATQSVYLLCTYVYVMAL